MIENLLTRKIMHLIRLVNFRSYQTYDHLLHRHQNPRLLKFRLEEPVYVFREGQSQSCIKSECIRERERERERMKARARARERGETGKYKWKNGWVSISR